MGRTISWIIALLLSAALFAACSGASSSGDSPGNGSGSGGTLPDGAPSTGDGASTGPTGLPCAVDTVLANNCRKCHASPPLYGAPMPLETWADLQAPAKSDPTKKVYELVEVRIHDDAKPMPQPPNPRLSAADTKTLDDWIAAGAPAYTGDCSGKPTPDAGGIVPPVSCTPDEHLLPAAPYSLPQGISDQYVCFGFDVTRATRRDVIAMTPKVDNTKIVHHLLLFQADTSVSSTPAPCDSGGGIGWRIVYGWAPGGLPMEMPPNVGFPEEGTVHYVVQVHYNNVNNLAGQTDDSGFDLCTTDQLRTYAADVMAFGTQTISIPPHATLSKTCSVTLPSGPQFTNLHVFAALPHMHKLGTQQSTVALPGGTGAPVDLGKKVPFDFNSQSWVQLDQVITNGDVIKTNCQWNNVTDQTVTFGEKTSNEMCYSFTMYYPRIVSNLWSWAAPALTSSCTSP